MKILFLDLDDVLILDKCKYLSITNEENEFYKDFQYLYKMDPFGVEFLNNLFQKNNDLYCVLQSTWRKEDKDWLMEHFRIQKLFPRFHDDYRTDVNLPRYSSISHWLSKHNISNENYAILDDEKPPVDFKTRTVRIDGNNGIVLKDCNRILNLLKLKWS